MLLFRLSLLHLILEFIPIHLKASINEEVLKIEPEEARELEETIEREFAHWADSTNCDLERIDNFYQLQQLAFLNALLSGDSFALMTTTKRVGSVYDLRIQTLEADRVSTPDNERVNPLFCEGVEKNKAGEVVAYYVSKFHPLSFADREPREWVRVLAYGEKTGRRNILHIMNRERIGQVRGVPFLAPVIDTIKQLGRYTEAEVLAAVINGLFTVFIEKESASDDVPFGESIPEEMQVDQEDENSIELAPGAVIDLGEGEKANMVNPGRPNPNFDPFVIAVLKQIGAALEIPYEILIMAFSSNYSASRAAILEFFKVVKMYRAWFVADFCQPIYEEWLSEAVAKGRIKAPGFFTDPIIKDAYCSAEWTGPSAGQLDPTKEVEAAEKRVQGGYSTREREARELTGTDFYKNIKQRKREEELLKEVTGGAKTDTQNCNVCLMGADALEAFLIDEEVLKVLDTRRFEAAVITPKELPNGATYIGTIHEIAMDIYTYNEWYLDNWTNKEEPEDKPLLPANIVVLLSTEANYSMYYGAVGVTDEAGKTIEVVEGSRIPEQWVERRPPRRFLQLNSAPLCALVRFFFPVICQSSVLHCPTFPKVLI